MPNATEEGTLEIVLRRLELTFEAIAEAFKVADESGSAAALEHLADYLNDCDAVQEEDIAHYESWTAKGKP